MPAEIQLANSICQDCKTDLSNAQDTNALRHASTRSEISSKNQLTCHDYLGARFVRDHHKHAVGLQYQKLFFQLNLKILLNSFNSNMKSTRQIKTHCQRLFKKARRSNVKSTHLQKRIQCEMKKQTPNKNKVMKWQKKSAKYVNRGLRDINEFDSLIKNNRDENEILFNVEKACILFLNK